MSLIHKIWPAGGIRAPSGTCSCFSCDSSHVGMDNEQCACDFYTNVCKLILFSSGEQLSPYGLLVKLLSCPIYGYNMVTYFDLKCFVSNTSTGELGSDFHLSPVKRICVFEHSVITNFNCACPAIQRGQRSGFLSEGSSWLNACMSEQRRFWRDCADAQARLNLRCSHRR